MNDQSTAERSREFEVRGKRGADFCKSMPGAILLFERVRQRQAAQSDRPDIYQAAKNCRSSVEMIEKYYGGHLTNTIDASAVNVRKPKPAPVTARKKAVKATT